MTRFRTLTESILPALRRLARRAPSSPHRRGRRWRPAFPAVLTTPRSRLLFLMIMTLAALVGALAWSLSFLSPVNGGRELQLTQVLDLASSGNVASATIYDFDHRIVGEYVDRPVNGATSTGTSSAHGAPHVASYWATLPGDVETPLLIDKLYANGAVVGIKHQLDKSIVEFVGQYVLPLVILANLFGIVFIVAKGGGGDAVGGVVQFGRIGRGRQRQVSSRVTFGDVGGADEALDELREVRDYLADPTRFLEVGAQAPKGVLLVGPPGCGKTLMARAVAGEAGVAFFSISGAEFVESLVGVGAARVRDLFRQVRDAAPAIVFIDELDAAGRRRGGVTGGQEEREQTLNQLLVEMDGFEPTAGIVVMGATNRVDILDPALLRPGRFDRRITVEPPDVEGRRSILELHGRSRPVSPDVDYESLARRMPGFTGADLANVMNEAALLSVRFHRTEIGMEELEEAIQRVMSGPRRRGQMLSADERRRIAYHEAGHAVVTAALGQLDAIRRISVMSSGRSLGRTSTGKSWQDRALLTRSELRAELVCSMGGIAAEELTLGEPSTGSEDDLERANALAQLIAGRYGMSERLGKVQFVRMEGSEFLGGDTVPTELTAGPVLMELHQEVRRLVDEAEGRALDLLTRHRAVLERITDALDERETLDASELEVLLEPVRPEMNLSVADVEPTSRNGHHALARSSSPN